MKSSSYVLFVNAYIPTYLDMICDSKVIKIGAINFSPKLIWVSMQWESADSDGKHGYVNLHWDKPATSNICKLV